MIAEIQTGQLNGDLVRSLPINAFPILENGCSHPSRIVSLYELMRRFNAALFMNLAGMLTAAARSTEGQIEADQKQRLAAMIGNFRNEFRTMGLEASKATTEKMLKFLTPESCTWRDFGFLADELKSRLLDETVGRWYFCLQGQEIPYYKHPRDKWEIIISRFPQAGVDIEEASRCWACSRYTAAVFHSVQIVEIGLIDLGAFIGVNDPMSGWTAVSQRLKKIIDTKYQDLSEFEKANRPFLEQLQGTVESLKNAWRNKISHAYGKLTVMSGAEFHPDVAEEILIATRAFMRRLAEGLPEEQSKESK